MNDRELVDKCIEKVIVLESIGMEGKDAGWCYLYPNFYSARNP